MKNKNQFVIDLAALELNDDQRDAIDQAIQKAVSAELIKLPYAKGKPKLVPISGPKDIGGFGDRTLGYRGVFKGEEI